VAEPSPNRWRGVPQDERQAERRRQLVDAGYELLGTVGVAGTTVRGVCEAARLNPRYFYESFEDLDELLVAVFDRTAVEALDVMLVAVAAVDQEDPLAVSRAGVGSFLNHVTADSRRAQVLVVEGLGNEALSRRRLDAMFAMAELFERSAIEKVGHEDVAMDPVVRVAATLIVGGMTELMISWLHGRLDLPIDELIDKVSRLFVALGEAADAIASDPQPSAT
jgi:AcrR family transcriptional regulator